MRAYFVATLSILVGSTSSAQLPYTEEQVIAYAKSIDVQTPWQHVDVTIKLV